MPSRFSKRPFRSCRRAATSIEYALIAGMIAIAIVAGLNLVGTNLQKPFNDAAAGFTP